MSNVEEPQQPPQRGQAAWPHWLALALLLTAFNAVKPAHIDDPAYLRYAAEFADHPLSPYAFEFGSPVTVPANLQLVPPVFVYWLAAGVALFGENVVLLKCWLFPFALLLAWAVDSLARRFAPGLRRPLLWLIVFSPSLLPGFNCMLDVPVLAVGLAALAVGIRAVDTSSWGLALTAGLIGGLAVPTKYNGLVPVVAVAAWGLLRRRPTRALVACCLALALAVGWELLLVATQGESHFLVNFRQRQGGAVIRCVRLVLPMLSHVAGLGAATSILALLALGWSGRRVLLAGLATAAGFLALALLPSQAAIFAAASGKPIIAVSNVIYALMAVAVWAGLLGVCWRLAGGARGGEAGAGVSGDRAVDWFLLAWLALEVAGYFALSPFPAARRLNGVLVVAALLAGRLAYLRGVAPWRAWAAVGYGGCLALLVVTADLRDARAATRVAHRVARKFSPADPSAPQLWHLNWCGFGYEAERLGVRSLRLNKETPRPGDLVAVDTTYGPEVLPLIRRYLDLAPVETLAAGDRFPLQAGKGYYSGRTPLEHSAGARFAVTVYRVVGRRQDLARVSDPRP